VKVRAMLRAAIADESGRFCEQPKKLLARTTADPQKPTILRAIPVRRASRSECDKHSAHIGFLVLPE